MFSVGR